MHFQPFYESEYWVTRWGGLTISELPPEAKQEFFKLSAEDGYKREYYAALDSTLADHLTEKLSWEDFDDEKRSKIRAQIDAYRTEMQAFGVAISKGEI